MDPDVREKNVCHNYLHQGAAHGEGAGYTPALQMAGVIQGVLLLFHEPSEGLGCLNPCVAPRVCLCTAAHARRCPPPCLLLRGTRPSTCLLQVRPA